MAEPTVPGKFWCADVLAEAQSKDTDIVEHFLVKISSLMSTIICSLEGERAPWEYRSSELGPLPGLSLYVSSFKSYSVILHFFV